MPIRGVGDAMRELKAGSKHIKTRAQAIAVGLKEQRRRGGKRSRPKASEQAAALRSAE